MTQAIMYKEWLKTKGMLLVIVLLAIAFSTYSIMQIQRVVTIRGAAHLWEILLSRDNIFIEPLKYIPLISGTLLAIAQYVPEMTSRRLKLTLHLPLSPTRISFTMLSYGVSVLVVLFALQIMVLLVYLRSELAVELVAHILYTALPWFLAGVAAYGLASWVCLEPTWGRRATDTLVSIAILRLFFIASSPEAYLGIMPLLILCSAMLVFISFISIHRFKAGVQ